MSTRLRKCRQRLVRIDHRLHELQADFAVHGARWDALIDIARAIVSLQRAKQVLGEQITNDIAVALARRRRRSKWDHP
jgi:hypothetical protein